MTNYFKLFLTFTVPFLVITLLFLPGSNFGNGETITSLIKNNVSFGSWDKTRTGIWHIVFLITNLGLPFLMTLAGLMVIVIDWLSRKKVSKYVISIAFLPVIFVAIPYIVKFTIYKGDMFKFFYFAAIFSVVITYWVLSKIRNRLVRVVSSMVIIFFTTTTSLLTLGNSYFNKNQGYTLNDLRVGNWIRENTPQSSIFISMPTVHTPISQIGGRLRVLSYINWPYSHGYNVGEDNVFRRLDDIKKVYNSSDIKEIKDVLYRYNVDYVFFGSEEKNNFVDAGMRLNKFTFLKEVYKTDDTKIYEVEKSL